MPPLPPFCSIRGEGNFDGDGASVKQIGARDRYVGDTLTGVTYTFLPSEYESDGTNRGVLYLGQYGESESQDVIQIGFDGNNLRYVLSDDFDTSDNGRFVEWSLSEEMQNKRVTIVHKIETSGELLLSSTSLRVGGETPLEMEVVQKSGELSFLPRSVYRPEICLLYTSPSPRDPH